MRESVNRGGRDVRRSAPPQTPIEPTRELLSLADADGALYLPENCNGPTGAEALLYAAEKSPDGIAGLKNWLEKMPPLRRQLITLYEIVEAIA